MDNNETHTATQVELPLGGKNLSQVVAFSRVRKAVKARHLKISKDALSAIELRVGELIASACFKASAENRKIVSADDVLTSTH